MSKKRWLIVLLYAVLCSQRLFAQTLDRRVLGINEMFRLADENSQSIQTYKRSFESCQVTTFTGHRGFTLIQLPG